MAKNISTVHSTSFPYLPVLLYYLLNGWILTPALEVGISDTPNNPLISFLSNGIKMSQVFCGKKKKNLNKDCSRSVCLLEQMGLHYWRNFTPNMNIAPGCFFFPPGRRRLLRVFSHIPQAQMVRWRLGAHRQTTVPSLNPGSAFSTRADWRAFMSQEHSQIPYRLRLHKELVSWCFCIYRFEFHQESLPVLVSCGLTVWYTYICIRTLFEAFLSSFWGN